VPEAYVEGRTLLWRYPASPPDFAGFRLRHRSGNRTSWGQGAPAHEGLITVTTFDLDRLHDAARDFQAAFIVAQLDPLRAIPILRVPGNGREPELGPRQLHARRRVHAAMEALGGISSPAGACVWHVVGLQRSVQEWAIRQGWGGRPVRQEQAQGILVAALGMLAAAGGHRDRRVS
jgi:hypothetical protein